VSTADLATATVADMRATVDKGIVVDTLLISVVHYDDVTQQKLNGYAQALADTQIATQQKLTAEQQRLANEKLATASSNDAGVKYQNCLNLIKDLAAKGQLAGPAGDVQLRRRRERAGHRRPKVSPSRPAPLEAEPGGTPEHIEGDPHYLVQGGRLVPLPPQGAGGCAGRAGPVGNRRLVVQCEPLGWVRAGLRAPAVAPGFGRAGGAVGVLRAVEANEGRLPIPRLVGLPTNARRTGRDEATKVIWRSAGEPSKVAHIHRASGP
jgi:hypothetical protein